MDKKRVFIGLGGAAATFLLISAAITACGDVASNSGGDDYSEDNYGTGSSSGTGSWGSSASGGFIGGDEGPPPPPPPPSSSDKDAGAEPDAEAPFLCDGLDPNKPVVLYLSADDSNSMASPAHARELLRTGSTLYKEHIRTYEFLNYYRISYPAPPTGQLAILPQAEATADPAELNLQLAVRSFDAVKPRRPITITFVLDTSGSMGGAPIERARAAGAAIAASLAEGDIVNMVTWSTSNTVVLNGHHVSGPNDATLLAAVNGLVTNGGTDLHGGLVAGYKLATENYGVNRLNRIILISDGGANVGVTDEDLIAMHSADADKEGIYMVGVGVGPAQSYNDLLMDTVTDKGRGAYIYLDEPAEAARMFTERFDETMEVAARGVQVEVTLPWYFKIDKFYGEEYSSNAADIEPQHLAPSDAMIFNQVLRACDASEIKQDDPITVKARWTVPISYAPMETSVTMTVGQLLAGGKDQLTKGTAIVAYAEALKAGTSEALKDALAKAQAANSKGTDPELNEIAELIQLHPKF